MEKVSSNVHGQGGHAALGEQEGFLSGSWIYGNINYKNGMSNATPVVGFIDKNIPGCASPGAPGVPKFGGPGTFYRGF